VSCSVYLILFVWQLVTGYKLKLRELEAREELNKLF